jgi:hypothetical protein
VFSDRHCGWLTGNPELIWENDPNFRLADYPRTEFRFRVILSQLTLVGLGFRLRSGA